jgi:hypothetical protein
MVSVFSRREDVAQIQPTMRLSTSASSEMASFRGCFAIFSSKDLEVNHLQTGSPAGLCIPWLGNQYRDIALCDVIPFSPEDHP